MVLGFRKFRNLRFGRPQAFYIMSLAGGGVGLRRQWEFELGVDGLRGIRCFRSHVQEEGPTKGPASTQIASFTLKGCRIEGFSTMDREHHEPPGTNKANNIYSGAEYPSPKKVYLLNYGRIIYAP